ncbi:MAG TPA: hypothetical protein VGB37_05560 [Candidatus Lokiarchaeia archaeon]
MIILDKNLNFVKWFNSQKEKETLKKGEKEENDISIRFIFCQDEKIIAGRGHYSEDQIQNFLDLGYKMFTSEEFEWIEGENKQTLYNNNGKAVLKTKEMLLEEEKEKKKNKLLNLSAIKQTALILNFNGEKENLEEKIKKIENVKSIEALNNI